MTTLRDQIEANIKANGWAGIGVGGTAEQPGIPFLYTIGLRDRGLPELLLLGGISKGVIEETLQALGQRQPVDGEALQVGEAKVVLRTLPPDVTAETYTRFAAQYYGEPVACMQIVFPDAAGLYPWQPGCDPETATGQHSVIDWRAEIRH